ncbi:MAG TPA: AraC family transcriptional regulator [Terriglobales bacterium]|nr:AraC family transcriptional regulator [Terriglobales bacterium]
MSSETNRVDIWRPHGLDQVELHRGTDVTLDYPRHWHDTVYICVVTNGTSHLRVRGASLTTTTGTLGVVPCGEVHANQKTSCTFRCLFIAPDLLCSAIEQFLERSIPAPEFRSEAITDPQAALRFLELHSVLENPSSDLERDASLFGFLQQFVSRHGAAAIAIPKEVAEDSAVIRARRLLDERYAEAVSLSELARLTGLSPFHLNRCFARKVGMPPHAYQLQLRLKRAKASLGEGRSATEAACIAGFFDQSHFTHHLKRSERMTPAQYQRFRKNLQDNRSHTTYFCCS